MCDCMYGSNKGHCSKTRCIFQQYLHEIVVSDKHKFLFTGHSREIAMLDAANMHVR